MCRIDSDFDPAKFKSNNSLIEGLYQAAQPVGEGGRHGRGLRSSLVRAQIPRRVEEETAATRVLQLACLQVHQPQHFVDVHARLPQYLRGRLCACRARRLRNRLPNSRQVARV